MPKRCRNCSNLINESKPHVTASEIKFCSQDCLDTFNEDLRQQIWDPNPVPEPVQLDFNLLLSM